MTNPNMKSATLALFTVLLCGSLAACKPPSEAAPASEAPAVEAPAAEPDVAAPVPATVVADPALPAAPATVATPVEGANEEDDTPHSGGDKVGVGN